MKSNKQNIFHLIGQQYTWRTKGSYNQNPLLYRKHLPTHQSQAIRVQAIRAQSVDINQAQMDLSQQVIWSLERIYYRIKISM